MNDEEISALAIIRQRMVNAADTIVRQRNLIDKLRRRNGQHANLIAELRGLHTRVEAYDERDCDACQECAEPWPCPNMRVLDRYDTEQP